MKVESVSREWGLFVQASALLDWSGAKFGSGRFGDQMRLNVTFTR